MNYIVSRRRNRGNLLRNELIYRGMLLYEGIGMLL